MKLGILGTGMIVQEFLEIVPSLHLKKAFILSSERSLEKANKLMKVYHLDGVLTSYDDLLKEDIDTIYVGLPNHLHFSFALKALEANKHVIIEKPIVSNMRELNQLKKAAKKHNRIILEAVTLHRMPAYLDMKKQLDKLGDIRIVSLNYSQYSSRYDAFKKGEILPAFDVHKSGGALYDLNVYNLNFVIGLFGKPLSVDYQANLQRGIDTSGIFTMDYGSFKAVCIGSKDTGAPLMNTIQGEQGTIIIDTPVSRMRQYKIKHDVEEVRTFEEEHAMLYEFKQFKNIIENNDVEKANEYLEISTHVLWALEEGRRKAGIIFDADNY